jgi:hypothetical protein
MHRTERNSIQHKTMDEEEWSKNATGQSKGYGKRRIGDDVVSITGPGTTK